MHNIGNILRKNDLVATRYEKKGTVTIATTNNGKYAIKKSKIDNKIKSYLRARNFDYIPKSIEDGDYNISEYIEGYDLPKEQKIQDLIELTALLHNKTTHYKEIDLSYYTTLYEDLNNNIEYLYTHYTDMINLIESKVFMSPSEYLLARNITQIYSTLDLCHDMVEDFYSLVKEKRKQRLVVLHNNLDLNHYIRNNNSFLVSWDKSKIDAPIFDIYKLYKKYVLDFDFDEILRTYEKHYPLFDDEKLLLYVLITLPDIISFDEPEYNMCLKISKMLDSMIKTKNMVLPYYSEYRKNKD